MPDQNQFWESLDKYRYILDSLPNPVIVTDMDKIVRYINVAARAIVPPPYEKLLNQPCSNFHTPYCHTKDCCIQRFLRNEKGAIQSGPGDIIILSQRCVGQSHRLYQCIHGCTGADGGAAPAENQPGAL